MAYQLSPEKHMPHDTRPIVATDLMKTEFGMSFAAATLFCDGLSPGVGAIGECRKAYAHIRGVRWRMPQFRDARELREVAERVSETCFAKARAWGRIAVPSTEDIAEALCEDRLDRIVFSAAGRGELGTAIDDALEATRAARRSEAAE